MAVLQFKFDESYDQRFMAIGGWIGEEVEWKKLETSWQRRIDYENFHNRPNQQITRFHASHLNARDHEFKHWTQEVSVAFSKKLIGFIARRNIGAISIASDMDALKAVFPEGKTNRQDSTYGLCIKQMMVELGRIIREYFPGDQVLLIHDHGSWNKQALEAYHMMVDDPNWEPRNLFVGLLPKTWDQSVGLQAADLIAYETYRQARAKEISNSEQMRAVLQEMLRKKIPVASRYMNLSAVKALREIMIKSGKYGLEE